jgi:sugar lactone lactonase YvrE
MRWLRGMNHQNESDALNEFWDEVVQRSPATPLTRDPVPTELGAIVRQLHAEQDARQQRPAYADRQLAVLLSHHREAQSMNTLNTYPLRTSDVRSVPSASVAGRLLGHNQRRSWIPAISAGAAIAILLAVIVALAIFANLFGNHDNHPVILAPSTPTSQASPSPTVEASLVWTYTGEGEDKLDNSTTGTIAPDGSIWVVDAANARIQILDPDGSLQRMYGVAGTRDGQFMFDMGPGYAGEVAVNPDGSFYVAEAGNARVQKFTDNGKFAVSWSGATTPIQTFSLLIGVSIDSDGNVWTADESANMISKFTPDGRFLLAIDGIDTAQHPEPFTDLGTLGFNPDGQLLVADGRGEIQVFDLNGNYLKAIPLVDANGDPIHAGYDVSTDSSGRMYVPDPESNSVYVYDADGKLLLTWSGPGAETPLDPWSVVADSDGNMYVVDVSASAVYKVHLDFH